MRNLKEVFLLILIVIIFNSRNYAIKPYIINGNSIKINTSISKENLNIDNKYEIHTYNNLAKINGIFKIDKYKDYDIEIVPFFENYKENIKTISSKDGWERIWGHNWRICKSSIDLTITFSFGIEIFDSSHNIIDKVVDEYITVIRGSGESSTSDDGTKWTRTSSAERDAVQDAKKNFLLYIDELTKELVTELKNNSQIQLYYNYIYEKKVLINQRNENFENIIWTKNWFKKSNKYTKNPFISINSLTQPKVDEYLLLRNPINLTSKIPQKIEMPKLPPLPKLVKDQFETKAMFNERVKEAINERQLQIEKMQTKYRANVENRNSIIEELDILYKADIESIKEEQKVKKEKLPEKILEFTQMSFLEIMGDPILENPSYDAESETMYIHLKASNANYQKRIALSIPITNAKNYYDNLNIVEAIIIYSFKDNEIKLEQIKTHYMGDTYFAVLTDIDFKSEKMEITLKDKKVDFGSEQQKNLVLQNPNLIDTYRVSALKYVEIPEASGLYYNDDITPLVEKLESKPIDSKKWLFIIAIENYTETDPVVFSKNSAKLFKQTAQKVFGIKERNTYTLIENKATSGAIKDKMQLLLRNVKYGDTIYFYYSGHGVPAPQSGESYILPKDKIVDFISREDDFKLSYIYTKLSQSKASKIIVFIDACFSGKTDNTPLFKGVAPGLIKTKKVNFDESKMVILTAGKDNQFSNSFDEKGHRMFSYFIIQSLVTRKDLNINLLFKDVSLKVHDCSIEKGDIYLQDPQIFGNKNLSLY